MNKKILLIDDDDDEQSIFNEAIHAASISADCVYANSAAQGIELLNTVSPDFIFVDYNMPAMNGIECLKEIKEKTAVKQTPVILYSTGLDEKLIKTAQNLGVFACLQKAFSISSLAKSLQSILTPNMNTIY